MPVHALRAAAAETGRVRAGRGARGPWRPFLAVEEVMTMASWLPGALAAPHMERLWPWMPRDPV